MPSNSVVHQQHLAPPSSFRCFHSFDVAGKSRTTAASQDVCSSSSPGQACPASCSASMECSEQKLVLLLVSCSCFSYIDVALECPVLAVCPLFSCCKVCCCTDYRCQCLDFHSCTVGCHLPLQRQILVICPIKGSFNVYLVWMHQSRHPDIQLAGSSIHSSSCSDPLLYSLVHPVPPIGHHRRRSPDHWHRCFVHLIGSRFCCNIHNVSCSCHE